MTKGLAEEKMMTDDERTIFVAYQYAGSAVVTNTFGTGAALLPISVLPVGIIIGIIFIVKVIGANIVRFYLKWHATKNRNQGGAVNG